MQNNTSPYPPREILLTFGKTGMGKSNYLKTYLAQKSRIIILDPLDEYPAIEFPDVGKMIDYLENENVKGVFNKPFCVKSCNTDDVEVLGEIIDSLENVTFMIEEAQRSLPSSRKDLPESIQRIILQGRHFGRSLVIAAQRPSIVHITARSQWTRIVTFHLTEGADVRWLEDTSGYSLQDEYDIRKLSVGDYYEITPGGFEAKRAPLYIPKRNTGKEEKSVFDVLEMFSAVNL